MKKSVLSNKAFTLVELLIVIAVIALLAVAIFVVVDPAHRFNDAKEAIRKLDTLAIERAIEKAIAEETAVPAVLASLQNNVPYMLVTDGGDDAGTCNCATLDEPIARIDIAGAFKNYLGSEVPVDSEATGDDTGYYISKTGNHFSVKSCNAVGDTFVQAPSVPETVTCYFDQYDTGDEEWYYMPNLMVDSSVETDAETFGSPPAGEGDIELLTHSTCAGQTFGTISQVRVRYAGWCMFTNCGIILRPVFGGTNDGNNHYSDCSSNSGSNYMPWVDITHDTNAPATWTTSDIANLDLDVEAHQTGPGTPMWVVFKIELEVTHTPD